MAEATDPRAQRTRDAILRAFTELARVRRYDAIRTAELIAAAGVGRSTFYEHFRSKDEVLVAAVEPILHTLASAALGRASPVQVRATLEHVWEQRGVARALFDGRIGDRLARRIATLITARLEAPAPFTTAAIAAAQVTMLRLWLSGAVASSAADLAAHIRACRGLLDPLQCSCESGSPE